MKNLISLSRRQFLKAGGLGAIAVTSGTFPAALTAAVVKPERDVFDGLKMGMTTYTLRKFTLDQAIEMTKNAGLKYISLKEVHLPLKSTREARQGARKKVEAAGLVLMGGGVIYMKNDEAEIRNVFDYAKDSGMPTIICSPDPEALDTVERMAKDYNLRIAIHNHGPTDKKYPSPLDVLHMVKNRDSRMGICMDVGHTVRINQDPVPVIEECAPRLYDFHMKDVTAPTAQGQPTEVGRGIIDIPAVLRALLKIKYSYNVALEYEAKGDDPMPGVLESIAYIRGALAAM